MADIAKMHGDDREEGRARVLESAEEHREAISTPLDQDGWHFTSTLPPKRLRTLGEVMSDHILFALNNCQSQRGAAQALGISRWSLSRRVRKYGLLK